MKMQPKTPGFYWAKWKICAPGTADEEDFKPLNKWEVVEVFENTIDETSSEHLLVAVTGVEKSQPLENFYWSCTTLIPPS